MRDEVVLSGQNFLDALLTPAVEAAGYRLVRLRMMGAKKKTLQVMAERPDGSMNVEDCAALSRTLSEVLEAADPIAEEFVLEVSSPGIDRPLTREADFLRFAGHEVRVEMTHGVNGRRRFKGVIAGLDEGDLLMDVTGEDGPERVRLPYGDIADAKLVLTDRLIQESLKSSKSREGKTSH
jgi:ribosome maturation factor RimP